MRQVTQNYRNGVLSVADVPAPTLRSGGLLVANCCSLVSAGTEKATVNVAKKSLLGKAMDRPDMVRKVVEKAMKDGLVDTMKMVFSRLDNPAALGYSCAGTVVEVGSRVKGFAVGDRVACAGQNYASHAEVIFVPENLCVKIPDTVDYEDAAYVTLGAIAMQGVRQAEPRLGDIIAVIGLGLLGQLTVQMLKANGCRVIASDIAPDKLALARDLGADEVVPFGELLPASTTITGGHGVDGVIITASTKDNGPIQTAGEICRKKGRVVVVGAVGMNLPREPYYLKELELRLSTSYGPGRYDSEYEEKGHDYPYGYVRWTEKRNMEAFLALIQERKLGVRQLTSHRFKIEDAERAYGMIMSNSEPYLGVILTYGSDYTTALDRVIETNPALPLDQINLGVIGAGNHVKDMLLPALARLKGVTIRAICTGTGVNAKSLAQKTGAAYCASDYREILNDKSINAVIIGTRHNSHAQMVLDSLRAGKHIFVEKPLCLTEDELAEISTLYGEKAKQGLKLMIGFNRRFSAHAQRAKEFLSSRRNPLVMVYRVNAGALPAAHWAQDPEVGGGRIIGEACHFIDYMQTVCAARPVSVRAECIGHHSSGTTSDQSILTLKFSDGSLGTVIYAAGGDTSLSKERCEIFGDGKSVVMDDFILSEFYAAGKRTTFKTRNRDKGFQTEMQQFRDTVINGGAPTIAFEDMYVATLASILAVKSLSTGESYDVR